MSNSIQDILKLNPNSYEDYEIIKENYIPVGISSVKIGTKTYSNYGAYWFFWEKTYMKEVSRGSNGAMSNINNISTFLTGHLFIDFSIIPIDDYRSIMRTHYEQNEVLVECYDPIYNKTVSVKMYFATEERKKLYILNRHRLNKDGWEDFLLLAGVQDYTLEMIGTNNDLSTLTVTYNLNAPSDTGVTTTMIGGQEIAQGSDFICGRDLAYNVLEETFGGRYRFVKWSTSPSGLGGQDYSDGYLYTLNTNMVLYAIWEKAENLTLSYSYGLSTPMTTNGRPVYSKNVKKDQAIGELPTFEASPKIRYSDDKEYTPYKNGGWYKTAVKTANSTPLTADTKYWSDYDEQIYLLYDTETYAVIYYNGDTLVSTTLVEYNTTVPMLEIYRDGYNFSGWYLDLAFKKPAPTLMPPYPIRLYARWTKK